MSRLRPSFTSFLSLLLLSLVPCFLGSPASATTLYTHLQYQGQPWYLGHEDSINLHGPITTTTFIPPGRYMIVTGNYTQITNFTVTGAGAAANTVVFNFAPGAQQPQNFLGSNVYGAVDGNAVYMLEYYTGAVVGSASGGYAFNGSPVVGGSVVTVDYPLAYTCTYGDVPPDLNDAGPDCPTCTNCKGMAQYSINQLLSALVLTDTPIGYSPPRGPAINFSLMYNSRSNQPGNQAFPNLGPQWTFNWLSYVVDDPGNVSPPKVYLMGGATEVPGAFDSGSQTYAIDPYTHAVLAKTGAASYERRMPDGSKLVYTDSDGAGSYPRKIFLSQWVDAAGQSATLTYDFDSVGKRLKTITDALGIVHTDLHYDDPANDRHITSVTNSLGKTALFTYDAQGRLTDIQDPVGIISHFTWLDSVFIQTLTTPYGSTQFNQGGSGTNRWLEVTDPLGGKERVEYLDHAPGISATEASSAVPTGFTANNVGLDVRNTFYWDKKATLMYPPVNGVYDYTKARVTHWLKTSDGKLSSRVAASTKLALENRIWNAYASQPNVDTLGVSASPTQVARVLDDGTTQSWQYQNSAIGKVTKTTDPAGRVTSYDYDPANGIDLLSVRQTTGSNNELLRTLTYNSMHEPLTDKDAAGQITTYSYNTSGRILTARNAKSETTTYAYGPSTGVPAGYLASITSPQFNGVSASSTLTYDTANRVRTITDNPDNYTVVTDYDALDRPTKLTYPDGTTKQSEYSQDFGSGVKAILDLTKLIDRRGRATIRHYDANRHIDSITEPLDTQHTKTTTYTWCTCGSLTGITDQRGKTTTLNRDLQSRITSKVYQDSTSISYVYENTTSRLASMSDANSQVTHYQYFCDDNLQQVSYTDGNGQPLNPPTPSASYTYDPNYNRIATMLDGTGTTNYSYYPVAIPAGLGAGQLQSVDAPPHTNDAITYTYDELGRVLNRSVNGVSSSVTYDSLGRLSTSDNPLGHFSRVYDGTGNVTPRLKTLNFPNGQSSNFSYLIASQDFRLQTLQDLTSGAANVSKFDYSNYDAEGQIGTWTKQLNSGAPVTSVFTRDLADQLTVAQNTTPNNSPTLLNYGYDDAGNRTSDNSATYSINDVNEINNSNYGYDPNGNLTNDAVLSYQWDAANRLTAIVRPGVTGRSEFTYDGLGRRVKIVEKGRNNVVMKTSVFLWDGQRIAEERDSSGTVLKRFLAEGVQIPANSSPNSKFYYSRDHLGSIRSLTNENGTVVSTLDYDPYGGISRTPAPANDTSGSGPTLTAAVSRLTHGSAGTFDINLPLSGAPGIEMRGSTSYTVVLTFDRPVLSATSASVASGVGSVSGLPSFSGNAATIQLSGVADRQTITVELDNVVGVTGTTAKVLVAMSVLACDVNQDGVVTAEDINAVQSKSGVAVSATTFKYDVTHNGAINSSDIAYTQDSESQDASLFPDFAFTGHYYHARSGLYLTLYRAYNPTIGRWLSRDPIGEDGGLNLYGYVVNDPLNKTDILGLCCDEQTINRGLAQLEVAYRKTSQGIAYAQQVVGRKFSCQESNCQLLFPRLPSPECWKCEKVHGYRRTYQLLAGIFSNSVGSDHWVIVCQAHNESGQVVREVEFDFWSGNERSVPFSDSGFKNPITGYPSNTKAWP